MFQRDQPELCTQMKRHSSQTKHQVDSSTNNKQTALPLVGAAVVATKQAAIVHCNTKLTVASCLQQLKCSEQTATDVARNHTHGFNYSHPEAVEWQMESIGKQTTSAAAAATSGLSVLLEAVDQVTTLQIP